MAAREFYRTHSDKYDFLVFFTDFPVDVGDNVAAFNVPVRNSTTGIAVPILNETVPFGSAGELESVLNMNNIRLYWQDAGKMVDPPIHKVRDQSGVFDEPPGAVQEWWRVRMIGNAFEPDRNGWTHIALNSPVSLLAHEVGHRWTATGCRLRIVHL
jgi:hypothetical protein